MGPFKDLIGICSKREEHSALYAFLEERGNLTGEAVLDDLANDTSSKVGTSRENKLFWFSTFAKQKSLNILNNATETLFVHSQMLLSSLFQCLRIMSSDLPGSARSLRASVVLRVLKGLSKNDLAPAEAIIGLVGDNVYEMTPQQAHDGIQEVLNAFGNGVLSSLQLLPNFLENLTSARTLDAGPPTFKDDNAALLLHLRLHSEMYQRLIRTLQTATWTQESVSMQAES
jgi:hypothetical protein